jgi:hypothetical protein
MSCVYVIAIVIAVTTRNMLRKEAPPGSSGQSTYAKSIGACAKDAELA